MQKGYAARETHDLKLALESFRSADEIMHLTTTAFEVARSQADLGLLVEAHETLREIMRMPEKPGEPQPFRDARGYAKVLDQQIVPRIPQLRLSVSGSPAAAVHVAKASAGTGRTETDVAEGESKDVPVTLQTQSTAAPAAPPSTPAPSRTESMAPVPAHRGFGPLAWVGFGVAVVGVGVGAVTGVITLRDKSSIASQCNGTLCPPSTYDKLDSASTMATVSTVSFAVGGAGAALGLAAWLLGWGVESPSDAATSATIRVTPYFGLASGGISARF
jgi:hypothetical protein